jgi:radical SAM superfamily enzyme YgiQ (UPF0313 family)
MSNAKLELLEEIANSEEVIEFKKIEKIVLKNKELHDKIQRMFEAQKQAINAREFGLENAYFMYSTRGCGMNCGFCAVKTLEPTYIPFISIKDQIRKIDATCNSPKKDLLLMDNMYSNHVILNK